MKRGWKIEKGDHQVTGKNSGWDHSPESLEHYCLDTVSKHITELTCLVESEANEFQLKFTQDVHLPVSVAEALLDHFGDTGILSDDLICLFLRYYKLPLRHAKLISLGKSITTCGLGHFSSAKLKKLTIKCDPNSIELWNISDLKNAFCGSADYLEHLDLSLYPGVNTEDGDIFDFVIHFKNLRVLIIRIGITELTPFDDTQWTKLLLNCSSLEILEITFPGEKKKLSIDSTVFANYGQCLRYLSLHSAFRSEIALHNDSCIKNFAELEFLVHLDLSVEVEPDFIQGNVGPIDDHQLSQQKALAAHVQHFIEVSDEKLPFLTSLDLSGIMLLEDSALDRFIMSHNNLSFIGLCLLQSKYCLAKNSYNDNVLEITGTVIESQILLTLKKYPERPIYLKEALKGLFHQCGFWTVRRPDIISLVLQGMENHPANLLLQMAGTACLYNLTREKDEFPQLGEVHIVQLNQVAELAARALNTFSSSVQIVKNCLLIFCNDKVLHGAVFDRCRISRLCLNCMLSFPESKDRHVTRMAVAIVSILACKISSDDTSKLTGSKEMQLLLDIAARRVNRAEVDGTLKFDLSALWNLTDESPTACHLFVQLGGMELFVKLLKIFPDDTSIQTKVLGLLNNIAEVFELHAHLVTDDLMDFVKDLIDSEEEAVSYFAAGIIANVVYGWSDNWILKVTSKRELLNKLGSAVQRWGILKNEIVTYRSFKPFLGLLEACHLPEVQSWAVWAIHHVSTLNPKRYYHLMSEECYSRLKALHIQVVSSQMESFLVDIFNVFGDNECRCTVNGGSQGEEMEIESKG